MIKKNKDKKEKKEKKRGRKNIKTDLKDKENMKINLNY